MKTSLYALLVIEALLLSSCTLRPSPLYTEWPFGPQEAARRQVETAELCGVEREVVLRLEDGISMQLVLIPAGKFMMGSPSAEDNRGIDEGPRHEVTITRAFYMGQYEVTRGEFHSFVNETHYVTDAEKEGWAYCFEHDPPKTKGACWRRPGFDQEDSRPVVSVSHNDAVAFCHWLSKKIGGTVTLPTEAQWEYACRAGTNTAFQWSDDGNDGEGWCNGGDQSVRTIYPKWPSFFPWQDGWKFTAPVGHFMWNAWGLCDMHGNVSEWCSDWSSIWENYYEQPQQVDPKGTYGNSRDLPNVPHVVRGGSWADDAHGCRSASRSHAPASSRWNTNGFRVVMQLR